MTNFTVRTVTYANQNSTVGVFSKTSISQFVELLIIGNPKFKQVIRGRKFFFSQEMNAFDECIVYLGRLNQGKWISDEDYSAAVSIAHQSWSDYDRETLVSSVTDSGDVHHRNDAPRPVSGDSSCRIGVADPLAVYERLMQTCMIPGTPQEIAWTDLYSYEWFQLSLDL